MAQLNIKALSADLARKQARWQARQTPQANLSDEEKRSLLGVKVDEASLARTMTQARARRAAAQTFAPEVDWRNRNGNHGTTVKDQQFCGSCVSFATTATVE